MTCRPGRRTCASCSTTGAGGARLGAHFVALRHTDRGFVGYNTYRTSTGADFYGPSLEAFLKKNGYFATTLVAIQNKGSCKE